MKRAVTTGAVAILIVVLLTVAWQGSGPAAATSSPVLSPAEAGAHPGLLYGRVETLDGAAYEGRLRWGVDQEALWSSYFNGAKEENPWAAYAPPERLPTDRQSFELFGVKIFGWENRINLSRPFLARFGHISRIEPHGRDLRVTLKSGAVFQLDRFGADDMNDHVRVWDTSQGVVDVSEWRIRTIDLRAPNLPVAGPHPLHGTVRTRHGTFRGFVEWDRQQSLGSDELRGRGGEGAVTLRFDDIRAIARRSGDSSLITLRDGRDTELSGTRQVGSGNRGLYVDDPRYGRVLVSWDAFERADFSAGGTGPAYGDFSPGSPLTGSVTTRSGRRLAGRLVYDLDESETTETLDAGSHGIDYLIPFGLVTSIVLPGVDERGTGLASVTLRGGERLRLEQSGDLGTSNAGMLVFGGDGHPEYVAWDEVAQIDFNLPSETDLAGGR
jgi:hypothetical protein